MEEETRRIETKRQRKEEKKAQKRGKKREAQRDRGGEEEPNGDAQEKKRRERPRAMEWSLQGLGDRRNREATVRLSRQ